MHTTPPQSHQKTPFSDRTLHVRSGARLAGGALAVLIAAFSLPSAHAASGTWIGTSSFLWGGPSNWSSASVPGSGDTATFNNAGNGNTSISLLGLGPITIGSIVFDTASAASYDIGSGDTLTLNASGTITMNASVALPQNIGASLKLGTASGAEAFTFTNNSTVADAVLFFADTGTISSGANSGVKTVTVTGAGITEIHGSITNGAGSVALAKTGTGTLNLVLGSILSFNTLNASDGTTNMDAALGTGAGTAAVTVTNTAGGAATSLRFGTVSQRLSSLTIGAGSTVTFTSGTASSFADVGGGGKDGSLSAAIVPEPGTFGLLLAGALGVLRRRRRD